ncbi:uncharacterized protein EV422DRAFT_580739 [Fimicolochytrium jonesii]|uniref:uncharacterized protein n=1 Tax=Fimicolochytrium jonesii TaxID=1396493 RepID=UPI0022FF2BBA|nr:uncharacterized protein EV422DRAFT_580739 [Fimicolochytrium jonesii]KAI8817391.1 hypothetical protein EV422DRAFT_580739 [Fimicolochytrium jonesii]
MVLGTGWRQCLVCRFPFGETAHIVPRRTPSFQVSAAIECGDLPKDFARNDIRNMFVLCPNHHEAYDRFWVAFVPGEEPHSYHFVNLLNIAQFSEVTITFAGPLPAFPLAFLYHARVAFAKFARIYRGSHALPNVQGGSGGRGGKKKSSTGLRGTWIWMMLFGETGLSRMFPNAFELRGRRKQPWPRRNVHKERAEERRGHTLATEEATPPTPTILTPICRPRRPRCSPRVQITALGDTLPPFFGCHPRQMRVVACLSVDEVFVEGLLLFEGGEVEGLDVLKMDREENFSENKGAFETYTRRGIIRVIPDAILKQGYVGVPAVELLLAEEYAHVPRNCDCRLYEQSTQPRFQRCSRCAKAYYCSRKCQKKD